MLAVLILPLLVFCFCCYFIPWQRQIRTHTYTYIYIHVKLRAPVRFVVKVSGNRNLAYQRASRGLCCLFRGVVWGGSLTYCWIWQPWKSMCFLCTDAYGEQALRNALRQRYLNAWNQPWYNLIMLDCSCDVRDTEQNILILYVIRMKGSLLGIVPVVVAQGIHLLGSFSVQQANSGHCYCCDGGSSYGLNTWREKVAYKEDTNTKPTRFFYTFWAPHATFNSRWLCLLSSPFAVVPYRGCTLLIHFPSDGKPFHYCYVFCHMWGRNVTLGVWDALATTWVVWPLPWI